MRLTSATVALLSFAVTSTRAAADGPKFAFETVQLTVDDIANFSAIAPKPINPKTPGTVCKPRPECRAFPGSSDWPADAEWEKLGAALGGGALLKPVPLAAACYPGVYQDAATCTALVNSQTITRAYFADPLSLSTQWPAGNPCPLVANPTGECTQGGLPVYVVNATSVKQIQIAVNFARNKNLRLVVKNTGHEFVGRSTGAGSLSIWTQYLKGFEILPDYSVGAFHGKAAHAGVGLQAWEVHAAMAQNDIALVSPSFATVGAFGGFMAGGGHSTMISYLGLASDQVLSLNVVTADGSFVTASPDVNSDIYFALRGGGGGTYGIVTSVVVKAHPSVNITTANIAISSLDTGIDLFWTAMKIYFAYAGTIVDAGGIDRNYIYPYANITYFNFTTQFEFPGKTIEQVNTLLAPLTTSLTTLGVTMTLTPPKTITWASEVLGEGAPRRDERFSSRLLPRAVWDDPAKYATAFAALKKIVDEGGYEIHGTAMKPSRQLVGYPGADSAVNPAFRDTVMHMVIYDSAPSSSLRSVSSAEDLAARARLSTYTDFLRQVTPGSGSYLSEGDVLEPNWQQSFFGVNYPRLLEIKNKFDPWGLFWAPSTVGSEKRAVQSVDGKTNQNGRLCRTTA
ncbi:hypothetical protein B0H63DRAFT_443578 [Podospora didyma]|uniref:FAD-binding PCMH-type domain-containing protein n=1 Tax=Podospora didyma TaxID=330526 RepID=A0AAE0U7I8_9PEZI|nr:hypothetical protein B0H63DRAFT_443578 [Podospora didyma]